MEPLNIGTVLPLQLENEMRSSYMDYAMSVIVSRALPDVRDGLKPVHRRILYAMQEQGMTPGARYQKCAAIIGEVLKHYHPHGDMSVYDSLVRMAQDFSLRYPLVDGQATSARSMATRRPPTGTRRRGSPRSPPNCWSTSRRTPSTSATTIPRPGRSHSCCPPGCRT